MNEDKKPRIGTIKTVGHDKDGNSVYAVGLKRSDFARQISALGLLLVNMQRVLRKKPEQLLTNDPIFVEVEGPQAILFLQLFRNLASMLENADNAAGFDRNQAGRNPREVKAENAIFEMAAELNSSMAAKMEKIEELMDDDTPCDCENCKPFLGNGFTAPGSDSVN